MTCQFIPRIKSFFGCSTLIFKCFVVFVDLCFVQYCPIVYNPSPEEIGARALIRTCTLVCTSDCSYLFGFARAIQDYCIHKREFLVAEACQIFHLGYKQDSTEL